MDERIDKLAERFETAVRAAIRSMGAEVAKEAQSELTMPQFFVVNYPPLNFLSEI